RGLDVPDLCISQGNLHSPEGLAEIAIAVMKQCPASPHLRKSTYSVAGTPLRQAAEVRAGSYIQGHRMLAGQCKHRLRVVQHVSAQPVENSLVHKRVDLSKRTLFSRDSHGLTGEPARPINVAKRPKNQRKKSHDDGRQILRCGLEGCGIRLSTIDRERSFEMHSRV